MNRSIEILVVVALTCDKAEHELLRGQVGTVVERLDEDVYEVEFSDDEGKAYATLALPATDLMILHHHPVQAGA